MKAVLVALNAQYIHTNLAVRSIRAYCAAKGGPTPYIAEYTINQPREYILQELHALSADVYIFSCYIWNIGLAGELALLLRKLLPNALLAFGGPQASYHTGALLVQNPALDIIIAGEGEAACHALLHAFCDGRDAAALPGLCVRTENGPRQNPAPLPLVLDDIPLPYNDPSTFTGRILYYESMRGCPYRCSYCLSSIEQGVRFKSLGKTLAELDVLLAAAPAQVKFVDRTFNCDKARALAIWQHLAGRDNGKTNFHFELAAELLDDEALGFLATVRPGLFQFEIGVQSCNSETLAAIRRPARLDTLFANTGALRQKGNVHLHLDLIAGLPFEDAESFAASFNTVYALRPHQFQLGFLKVLPGSGMEQDAERFGIAYSPFAPFEVLYTRWLPYSALVVLKRVAAMVELYYNSGRFGATIAALCAAFPTPYTFYEALAAYYVAAGHELAPPGKTAQYGLLGAFAGAHGLLNERLQWLCRYDMARHEKIKKIPGWVTVDGSLPHRSSALAFYANPSNIAAYLPTYAGYNPKQLLRTAHIEVFPFHPETGEEGSAALLFDYSSRDVLGYAASFTIELP